jgi:co-chaperonin GroES (HSP10)
MSHEATQIIEPKPLVTVREYVVIDPSEEHEATVSGILMPSIADRRSWTGKVVAVGPGLPGRKGSWIPCNTRVGQWVAYDMRSLRDFCHEGKWYHIVRDEAVFFEYDEDLNNGRLRMGRPFVDHEF